MTRLWFTLMLWRCVSLFWLMEWFKCVLIDVLLWWCAHSLTFFRAAANIRFISLCPVQAACLWTIVPFCFQAERTSRKATETRFSLLMCIYDLYRCMAGFVALGVVSSLPGWVIIWEERVRHDLVLCSGVARVSLWEAYVVCPVENASRWLSSPFEVQFVTIWGA